MVEKAKPDLSFEEAVQVQVDASNKLAVEAREALDRSDVDLASTLNELLNGRIGPFKTNAAEVAGSDGTVKVGPFALVLHQGDVGGPVIPVDGVAAVIDAVEELTFENLRAAYDRAREVKALTKRSVVEGTVTDPVAAAMTIVIVFARHSSMSLDEISDEMSKLNLTRPAYSWPDMIAVDGKGIINYATRVPGEDKLSDFLLPVQNHAPSGLAAPLYIYKVIRAGGRHTFNKVAALLAARIGIFAPGTVLGKFDVGLAELSDNCVVTDVHQFNMRGELHRLSDADHVKELLPTDLYGIAIGKKEMGSIQFRRWQEGGYITMRGQFPIEPFLVFLRAQVPHIPAKDFQFIRRPAMQVSMVQPITEQDFLRALAAFQARTSGITIKKDTRKLLIQKYADEGTSSPFYGRLMLGVFKVRELAMSRSERQPFDKLFDATFTALVTVRDAAEALRSTLEGHRDKVASRAIVQEQGRRVQITETIDKQLKRDSETFVTGAVRTLKSCMQTLTGHLDADIGFLFKRDGAFKAGLEALALTDPVLSAYIADARKWTEPLIDIRNNEIEHGLGADFRVTYDLEGTVAAREPLIRGEPLSVFVARVLDRLSCFVEEVTVHLLQKRLPDGITLTEVIAAARTSTMPERFRTTTSVGGLPPWQLAPHQQRFEDC